MSSGHGCLAATDALEVDAIVPISAFWTFISCFRMAFCNRLGQIELPPLNTESVSDIFFAVELHDFTPYQALDGKHL